ncbi:MAG: ribonuclease D [Pseudomonadota bacterium]|nr:ribonuclease D [Pseudomonadota bacterium]MDE3037201.1 ribonuclease D [Pseudomonadota bacterium]
MTNHLHQGDLPAGVTLKGDIAVDTEAMGLNNKRDRLCLVQLSDGNGDAHLVQFAQAPRSSSEAVAHVHYDAPNLKKLLADPKRTKIFHFARFDLAIMRHYLGIRITPVFCTRTASRLVRTYTDRHGYKEICKELLGVDVSKQQQSSDWGAGSLTREQIDYAAADVLYLHRLRDKLDEMLSREGREDLAQSCFNFLPCRAELDLAGWENEDIFAHG